MACIAAPHTAGGKFGELMNIVQPKLGVAYHYFLDDDTFDAFNKPLHQTTDQPLVLVQDLMVINITPEHNVSRIAQTDLLHWLLPATPISLFC